MNPCLKRLIDWAFAITFFFAVIFVLSVIGSLASGDATVDVAFGPYSYKGPLYGCLPLMVLGVSAVGGCVFYVILSFQEGRSERHARRVERGIRAAAGGERMARPDRSGER